MSKGDFTDERLSYLLQHGDPAGEGSIPTPDPIRRDVLLIRCSESLSRPGAVAELVTRRRVPLVIGAFALSASLLILFIWMIRPKESLPIPQVAVITSPQPTPDPSRGLTPPAAKVPDDAPKAVLSPVALEKPARREMPTRRLARRRRHARKHAPAIALQKLSAPESPRNFPAQPMLPAAGPKPTPEYALSTPPVVEKVILISDDTPLDPEPDTGSVTIAVTEESHVVIVSRPLTDKTRR